MSINYCEGIKESFKEFQNIEYIIGKIITVDARTSPSNSWKILSNLTRSLSEEIINKLMQMSPNENLKEKINSIQNIHEKLNSILI